MAFGAFESSRRFDDNTLSRYAVSYEPQFGEISGAMVGGTFTSPMSLTGVSEAEIIGLTEGNGVSMLAWPILGARNIISHMTDPETWTSGRGFYDFLSESVYKDLYTSMDKEQWEASEYYREGMHYNKNMNVAYARVMAERHDREHRHSFLLSRASTGQMAGATVVSIAAGIFEPVNLAAGVGVSAAMTSAIRSAGMSATSLSVASTVAGSPLRRITTEGLVAGVGLEVLAHEIVGVTGEQYTLADSFINIATSIAAGAVIHGIGSAYGRMRSKLADGDYINTVQQVVNDAVLNGRDPMAAVEIVNMAANADSVPKFTTLTPEEFASPKIAKTKDGFVAVYENEGGVLAGARGVGKTQEAAIASLVEHYNTDFMHKNAKYSQDYIQATSRIQSIEDRLSELGSERGNTFISEARRREIPIDELDAAKSAKAELMVDFEAARMRVDEFPDNKKYARDLASIERKMANAQNVIDNFENNYREKLNDLRGDFASERQRLKSESKKLEDMVIAEQQKNLARAWESYVKSGVDNNAYAPKVKENPAEINATERVRNLDEAKVDTQETEFALMRIEELKKNNDLTEADILEMDAISEQYKKDLQAQETRKAAALCLRG